MAAAWIQQFYNDTDLTFWLRSVDTMNNGDAGAEDGRGQPRRIVEASPVGA